MGAPVNQGGFRSRGWNLFYASPVSSSDSIPETMSACLCRVKELHDLRIAA